MVDLFRPNLKNISEVLYSNAVEVPDADHSPEHTATMNCNDLQEGARPQRYLIKRPKALQWFHNGQLHKTNEEERQAGRFELFLDLLYVAIVANFSDELSENPDGQHLAKYVLIFAPAWYVLIHGRERPQVATLCASNG